MFSSMNEREKSINDSRCDKHVWFLMQKIRINLENIFFRHLFPRAPEIYRDFPYVCQNNWNFLNSIYRAYVGVCVCLYVRIEYAWMWFNFMMEWRYFVGFYLKTQFNGARYTITSCHLCMVLESNYINICKCVVWFSKSLFLFVYKKKWLLKSIKKERHRWTKENTT